MNSSGKSDGGLSGGFHPLHLRRLQNHHFVSGRGLILQPEMEPPKIVSLEFFSFRNEIFRKKMTGVIGRIPLTAPPSPPKSSLCVWPSVYARSERLCSAPVATRLSAYVTLLWRPDIRETPLCPWSLFLVRASVTGRLYSYVRHTCV